MIYKMFISIDKYILNPIGRYIIMIFNYCFQIYNFIITTTSCNETYYYILCNIILNYMVSSIK